VNRPSQSSEPTFPRSRLLRGRSRALVRVVHLNLSSPIVKAVALALLMIANCATASVEFAGVSIDPSGSHFLLYDATTGVSSGWIGIGDSFIGYNVVSFDAKAEMLAVKFEDSTFRLHLRSSANLQSSQLSPNEKRRLAPYFANNDDLILAEVTVDGLFVSIAPLEVWKGTNFAVKTPIRIPREQFTSGVGVNGSAVLWILGFKAAGPNGPNSLSLAQGTDGVISTPGGVPLDELRAYKNDANQQLPDPTTPSVTPPAGAGGAPSVAADHSDVGIPIRDPHK